MAEVYVEFRYECVECGRIHSTRRWVPEEELDDMADGDPDNVRINYEDNTKNVVFRTDLCRECEESYHERL